MFTDNNSISKRQETRMGILENIVVPFLVVPYISVACGGGAVTFIIGLILAFIYAFYMSYIGLRFQRKREAYMEVCPKWTSCIYMLRYGIKAGIILCFFAVAIKKYLMYDINEVVILIVLSLVSLYGSVGNIEHRGRLIEIVFYWTIIPLIATLLIGLINLNWSLIGNAFYVDAFSKRDTYLGAVLVLCVMSALEFNIYQKLEKDKWWRCFLKKILWIFFIVAAAYILIIGILGEKFISLSLWNSLSVMECVGTGINGLRRIDYLVLAFFVIGMFAVISGYYFRGTKHLKRVMNNKTILGRMIVFFISITAAVCILYIDSLKNIISIYLVIDLILSVILPLVTFAPSLKNKIAAAVIIFILPGFLTGCWYGKYTSIEKQDYITELTITENKEEELIFVFKKTDLSEYGGKPGDSISYEEIPVNAKSLEEARNLYKKSQNTECDLGHLIQINLSESKSDISRVLTELVDSKDITKSVIINKEDEKETLLAILQKYSIKEE